MTLARIGNLDVVDLRESLPQHPTLRYEERAPQEINLLVVHHSATPARTSPAAIARYHIDHWDWPGIGYHALVDYLGRLYYTGDLATSRAHVYGHNHHTVGVCLIGDFTQRRPSDRQLRGAANLLAETQYQLGAHLPIVGHRDMMATECPGATWAWWRPLILPAGTPGAGPTREEGPA